LLRFVTFAHYSKNLKNGQYLTIGKLISIDSLLLPVITLGGKSIELVKPAPYQVRGEPQRVSRYFSISGFILVVCVINPFTMFVIPAEAGIQKNIYWMPHQVRHDMPTKSKEVLDALH
jgi:hypothetical protein